ncbi:MAG: LD-carboxypeptidase, partial [Calditrichaeota bacterium]|nr:LD-carboxypeptidase [Calditrichota bacterium]
MDIIFPPPLNSGDLIGVVSPASPPYGEKGIFLDRGLNHLLSKGYRLLEGEHLRDEYGYLAGTDNARANDLNRMIQNPDVKAIFCSRGGYGTTRILDKIDYSTLYSHPKIIMGYSDITALQMAVLSKTGLVSFSGPMVAVEMGNEPDQATEKFCLDILTRVRTLKMNAGHFNDEKIVYRAGSAKGRLMGGCLSMLCSLIGTPYL